MKTCKVSISVYLSVQKMNQVQCVLGKGAGIHNIRKYFLQTEWLKPIRVTSQMSLQTVTSHKIIFVKTTLLHVHKGDACVRVTFRLIRKLVLPVLLGATFIDNFVEEIFPPEQNNTVYHTTTVPVSVQVATTGNKQNQEFQKQHR